MKAQLEVLPPNVIVAKQQRQTYCPKCKQVTPHTEGLFSMEGDIYEGSMCHECRTLFAGHLAALN